MQPTSPNNVASLPADSKTAPQAQTRRQRSAQDTAEQTLREAFPAIEASVIKAVLVASGGQVEPAFNALLGESLGELQIHGLRAQAYLIPALARSRRSRSNLLDQHHRTTRQHARN